MYFSETQQSLQNQWKINQNRKPENLWICNVPRCSRALRELQNQFARNIYTNNIKYNKCTRMTPPRHWTHLTNIWKQSKIEHLKILTQEKIQRPSKSLRKLQHQSSRNICKTKYKINTMPFYDPSKTLKSLKQHRKPNPNRKLENL